MRIYTILCITILSSFTRYSCSYEITICNDNSYKFNPIELSCIGKSTLNITEAYVAFTFKTSISKECDADVAGTLLITSIIATYCNSKATCLITNDFINKNKIFDVEKYAFLIKSNYFEIPLKLHVGYDCENTITVDLSQAIITSSTNTQSTTINSNNTYASRTSSVSITSTRPSSTKSTYFLSTILSPSLTNYPKIYYFTKNSSIHLASSHINLTTVTFTTSTTSTMLITSSSSSSSLSSSVTYMAKLTNLTTVSTISNRQNHNLSDILIKIANNSNNSPLITITKSTSVTSPLKDTFSEKHIRIKDNEPLKIDSTQSDDLKMNNEPRLDSAVLAVLISLGAAIVLTIISIVLYLYYKHRRTMSYKKELQAQRTSPINSPVYNQSYSSQPKLNQNETNSTLDYTDLTIGSKSKPKSKVIYHVETIDYGSNETQMNKHSSIDNLYSTVQPRILQNENLAIPIQVNYDDYWKTKI